jgi:predicted lipoprotein with Yx(FWY)xxD motif
LNRRATSDVFTGAQGRTWTAELMMRKPEMKKMSSRSGKRFAITAVGAMAAALALAGCGGGNNAAGTSTPAGNAGSAGAVAVKNVDGVGMALVDSAGKTLYFTDQEAGGSIKCTAACLSIWFPASGAGATGGAVAGLSTVHRPDNGQDQLTFQGKPLYTFKLDTGPGQDKGQNAQDSFGGTQFTWHAAATSAAGPATSAAPPANTGGGGYGY